MGFLFALDWFLAWLAGVLVGMEFIPGIDHALIALFLICVLSFWTGGGLRIVDWLEKRRVAMDADRLPQSSSSPEGSGTKDNHRDSRSADQDPSTFQR